MFSYNSTPKLKSKNEIMYDPNKNEKEEITLEPLAKMLNNETKIITYPAKDKKKINSIDIKKDQVMILSKINLNIRKGKN